MKKMILAIAALSVASVACNKQKENQDTSDVQMAALNERLSLAQDSKDSLIFLMSDIYSGIEEINVQENMLYNLRGAENAGQREEIIENLTRIKTELAERQAKLDALARQFNDSNDKNKQLAAQVAQLKKLVSEKEAYIARLQDKLKDANFHIEQLRDTVAVTRRQVTEVTAQKVQADSLVQVKTQENQQLVNDANRVYYCIGTKKELEKNNILKKKKIMQGDYEMSYFKEADRRTLTSIPCYNKKVEILSGQPKDSYRIDEAADKSKTIVITNPARFWGTTHFLVIKIG